MPNFSLNDVAIDSRSRSAPTIANRSDWNCSRSHLRTYDEQNVGVLMMMRCVVLGRQLANGVCVHRIGVVDDAKAADRREPDRSGEAERVEERKHAEQHVGRLELEQLADRVDVREDVAVREHDAFGRSGAPARKNDRRERSPSTAVDIQTVQDPGRKQSRRRRASAISRPEENAFITSSRKTMLPVGSMPAFERNRRDVRIVLMADCSIAMAIDSRPAVKFRLTGTLPDNETADVGERSADGCRKE